MAKHEPSAAPHDRTPESHAPRRLRSTWLLALLLALGLAITAPLPGQHRPRRAVPQPIDFATSQNDNLFSLVRSQDDIHALETALEEIASGKHEAAVRRLHELLRLDPPGVVPVAPGRYLGIRTAVVTVLGNLSPAGQQAYEQLAQREAGTLLSRALHDLSPRQLAAAADRFPVSKQGKAARLLLADRALEAGDGLRAARHYRAALDATRIGSKEEARVVDRLNCADVLVDPSTARAQQAAERIPPASADVLSVTSKRHSLVAAIGGGRSGATPMDNPVGRPQAFWRQQVDAPGFGRRDKGQLAMYPVGDLDGIYCNTGRELVALDPLRREVQWVSRSPIRDIGISAQDNGWEGTRRRGRRRRSPYDAINQDMVLSAAASQDIVVCHLQVPDDGVNVDFQASFRVITKIPQRRLFAFSRQTGKQIWAHFDELDGPRTRRYAGHDACAPPIIAGDTVYAPIQDRTGAIAFSIAAYDLHTGDLKWRRLVCSSQQDVNMFGNARAEFASSPLALHGGVLYGATNLGVTYALDALSGRLRWIHSYDVVRMPQARLRGQADRPVFFANNPPVVVNGVVCFTPLDSQFALGQDVDTGTLLWRLPYDAQLGGIENRVQWLCGAIDDEFVLGGAGVVAVKARPDSTFGEKPVFRQLVRPDQISDRRIVNLPARPAVTADHVWVPTRDAVLAFDRAGNPHEQLHRVQINGYQPGNLMLVDGALTSLRNRSFDVALDSSALLERSIAQVRKAPKDPNALLRLATLQRALLTKTSTVRDSAAVQELYRRGLQACIDRGLPKTHPTRQALQRELFRQALAVADRAAKSASPDTLERLAKARDLAPDTASWIEVHTQVIARCRADRELFLRELDRLEQQAPTANMPAPLHLAVPAFVLWQRALAHENVPSRSVALWQQLLENHGDAQIGSDSAAGIAEAAITRLVTRHGAAVYSAVDERANQALANAGKRSSALQAITRQFPNSDAARQAGLLLLDSAVRDGDLGVACDVLGRAIRAGDVAPGILRRVQVAALRRGNRPLALTMLEAIQQQPDGPSDWPGDEGLSFAEAAQKAATKLPEPVAIQPRLPAVDAITIPPRTRQEYLRMLPTRAGRGFARLPDTPIYVVAGSELVAFDLTQGKQPTELFSESVDFLEHVLTCGNTLIVPDMERVFAIDYRTGEMRWELEFDTPRLIESLGITNGVLHISAQPRIPDGNSELIGLEPITGTRVFTRALGEQQLKPKPIAAQLLLMTVAKDKVTIDRLDPITGKTVASVPCDQATLPGLLSLRPDSLATRLYPQFLSGDEQHIYLPIDGRNHDAMPQVIALRNDGSVAWHWRGTTGSQILLAQRRADALGRETGRFVIAEGSDQASSRILLLDSKTGSELRKADLGHDANVLNWERAWLDNPAPANVVVGSQVDRQTRQRQLICFAVDEGPTFAVPLRPDDGDIERTPQFGDKFLTFGVRPRNAGGRFRLYAVDLTTRRGALPGNQKSRSVQSRGAPHGMSTAGPYTVLSTTQGLILLSDQPNENR